MNNLSVINGSKGHDLIIEQTHDLAKILDIVGRQDIHRINRKPMKISEDAIRVHVRNLQNIFLLAKKENEFLGLFPCYQCGPGVYDIHMHVAEHPENCYSSGKLTIDVATQVISFLFLNTDCISLAATIPASEPRVSRFVKHLTPAFRPVCDVSESHGAVLYDLALNDWIGSRPHIPRLNIDSKIVDGWAKCFSQMAAAAMSMIANGQVIKGVELYNEWAWRLGKPGIDYFDSDAFGNHVIRLDENEMFMVGKNGVILLED